MKNIFNAYTGLSSLVLTVFLINTEINSVSVALPTINTDHSLSATEYFRLIGPIYMVLFSSFILISSKLGDYFSNQLVFHIGLVIFIGGSCLAGCTSSMLYIVLGRALQGLGAAFIWPNAAACILNHPRIPHHTLLAIFTTAVGLAIAVGPILGGMLCATLGWRSVFWINAPIGMVLLLVSHYALQHHSSYSINKQPLKLTKAIIFACLLFFLSVVIINLPETGLTKSLIIAALALFSLFTVRKWQDETCKLKLHTIIGCINRFIMQFSFMGLSFLISFFLQRKFQLTSWEVGKEYLICTTPIFIFSYMSGKLSAKISTKKILFLGLLLSAIAYSLLSKNAYSPTYLQNEYSLALFILGTGYAIASPALLNLTIEQIDPVHYTEITGHYFLLSTFGNAMGIALVNYLFSDNTITDNINHIFSTVSLVYSGTCLVSILLVYLASTPALATTSTKASL